MQLSKANNFLVARSHRQQLQQPSQQSTQIEIEALREEFEQILEQLPPRLHPLVSIIRLALNQSRLSIETYLSIADDVNPQLKELEGELSTEQAGKLSRYIATLDQLRSSESSLPENNCVVVEDAHGRLQRGGQRLILKAIEEFNEKIEQILDQFPQLLRPVASVMRLALDQDKLSVESYLSIADDMNPQLKYLEKQLSLEKVTTLCQFIDMIDRLRMLMDSNLSNSEVEKQIKSIKANPFIER